MKGSWGEIRAERYFTRTCAGVYKGGLGRRRDGRLYGTAVRNRTRLVTDDGAGTSQGRTGAALYRARIAGYSAFWGWMAGSVLDATTACSTVSRAMDLHSGLLRSQSLR